VSVNEVSRVDAALEVGTLTDTVTVASDLQLLQTDKADTHTEISSAAITVLPLDQNRNYQTLINLVPGATPGRMQNSEVDTPGRALTTNVNGMDRNTNGTKTDGATNVNIWLPHHTMYVSPAETIDLTTSVLCFGNLGYVGNSLGSTLTVTDGTHTARLAMLGSYVAASFHLANDGNGGTLVFDPPVDSGGHLAPPHWAGQVGWRREVRRTAVLGGLTRPK
jgi:hypothetical protein